MFAAKDYPITIAEFVSFYRDADRLLTPKEHDELINFLAANPDHGDVIPGTGGLRKLRWPAKSQGKRSGARIIYYFRDLNMPLYVLAMYVKNERLNLTEKEKRLMAKYVAEIVSSHSARLIRIVKGEAS